MQRKKAEHLKRYDFKPLGEEPLDEAPVCVRLPARLAAYVRSKPNRSQWLVTAIERQIASENQ